MRPAVEGVALDPGGDEELVIRARAGDRDSYEMLFRRHRERVARTSFLLVRDRHLAQDVTQEAFLIGWRDLRRLRTPDHFRAWVTGIAVNLARRRGVGIRLIPGRPAVPLEGGPERADQTVTDADLDISVREAVAALPVRLREAVVLRFYGGFSEAEMSSALGIPAGTVKSRLARARARLAGLLRDVVEEA
jgi:RNA polymerase sigma-70 factor (ECF subfamily)